MRRNRPYVICHMTTSIDGKVTGSFLNSEQCTDAINEYYRINREHSANAFACGRVTMEESFTKGWNPDLSEFKGIQIDKVDYIANQNAKRYAVAFDRKGRLGWTSSCIEDEDPGYGGAHIIEILTKQAQDEYLAYLQKIGVSYLFAGDKELDLETALEKLWSNFFIETLLLEGGSMINGAFERADLIDEFILVQAPVVADASSKSLFENSNLNEYVLTKALVVSKNVLVINYLKKIRAYRSITMSKLLEAIDSATDAFTFYYDFEKQETVFLSDGAFIDFDEELADLIDCEPDRFVRLPDQYEIHEYRIMEAFIDQLENQSLKDELIYAIHGKGAFRRLKTKIRYAGIEEQWYQFLRQEHIKFALEWCRKNDVMCLVEE